MKLLILSIAILTLTSSMSLASSDFEDSKGLTIEVMNSKGEHTSTLENLDYTQANQSLPVIMGKKVKQFEVELRGPTSDEKPGI